MFEQLRDYLLCFLPEDNAVAKLISRDWNELVMYSITVVLEYYHLTRILLTTDWPDSTLLMKSVITLYLILVLVGHEMVRMLVWDVCTGNLTFNEVRDILIKMRDSHTCKNLVVQLNEAFEAAKAYWHELVTYVGSYF